MSAGSMTSVKPEVPAKRGDLAVIISTSRDVAQGKGSDTVHVVLARVSGITRAGLVTRYEEALFADADDRERKVRPHERIAVVGADVVDVEAVLVDYRAHTWRATTGADSDMIRAYPSLESAKAAIRKWRYTE